tara:strand:+ start:3857 stop:4129 length:273 start_codon:yes stop_codon:yes gene_type:complete
MVVTHKHKFNKKYGFDKDESHSLSEIAKLTGYKLSGLKTIYSKGLGAYHGNPSSVRPNVKSAEQWAMARIYSAVGTGKASKVDATHLIKK